MIGSAAGPSPVDVSVVISTFQRRASLRRTLDSLLRQLVPVDVSFEVLVVDNNCSDGTRDLLADYSRRYPSTMRCIVEREQGVSAGRNAGIRAARGAIVAFTDDDNEVSRHWVATILSTLRSHPDVAGVGGKVLPEWPRTPPSWLDRRHWSPLAILDYGDHAFETSASRPTCLITANLAVRRDVLLAAGGFTTAYLRCQDHDLQLRLWQAGHRLRYEPSLVVFAPVEPRRLTRAYHRRWHAQRGYYGALLGLEELHDSTGTLRRSRHETPRLLGAPGYVYRSLLRDVRGWCRSVRTRDAAAAAHHEDRAHYLASYLRHTSALSRSSRPPAVLDALRFSRNLINRQARHARMPLVRFLGAHALIAILLGWSAWDTLLGREHWPFSPYPMFSNVERSYTLDSLQLRGVTAGGEAREVVVRDGGMIAPFDQCRIITAMQRVATASPRRLDAMLGDALSRYERARQEGRHDGPALTSLRVYRAQWQLRPDASNADSPERATMLAEVRTEPAEASAVH